MTENKHTAGPWKLILHGNERYPYPLSLHTVDEMHWIARDGTVSSLANARLMAAAPEMLEALHKIGWEPIGEATASDREVLDGIVEIARRAIAKAEGREDCQ